jgi:hypothetical protein
MGKVMGPVSAVSGFHGAGPVRRACGMCFVITIRAAASSGQAFAVADRDAIVAPGIAKTGRWTDTDLSSHRPGYRF